MSTFAMGGGTRGLDFLQQIDIPSSRLFKRGNFVVLEEDGESVQGAFLIHQVLLNYYFEDKDNGKALLLTTIQGQDRWTQVGGKVGWGRNAKQMIDNGRLHFVDLIQERWTQFEDDNSKPQGPDLKDIFDRISTKLEEWDTKSLLPSLVIIEDLTALIYQLLFDQEEGDDKSAILVEKTVVEFALKLKRLSQSRNAVMITLISSSEDNDDPCLRRVTSIISQTLADLTLRVSPLSTGASESVHGVLHIRDKTNKTSSSIVKSLQYKIEDNGKGVRIVQSVYD